MTQQHIVRIENYCGETVYATVLEEVQDGFLKGWNHLQMPDGSTCYMARCWCLPLTDGADRMDGKAIADNPDDTDWRKFLRDHWDDTIGGCKVECLDDFMRIFIRAAAVYMKGKYAHVGYDAKPLASAAEAAPQPMKPHYVQLSLFD